MVSPGGVRRRARTLLILNTVVLRSADYSIRERVALTDSRPSRGRLPCQIGLRYNEDRAETLHID